MPIYTESVKLLIYEEDVRKMWQSAKLESDQALISLLWITGARPSEIMPLKRRNIDWGIDALGRDYFSIKLETKKLGVTKKFMVAERILKSSRPLGRQANPYIETLIRWSQKLDLDDYVVVGGRTTRWLNKRMHKLSSVVGHVWCVYTFRHSVFSHMSRAGASSPALMAWKGSANISSVAYYVHAMPAFWATENDRRERDLVSITPMYRERYEAVVKERPATEEEVKRLPDAEKEGSESSSENKE